MIYHVFDPTTPWFEWLSYQECCWSLVLFHHYQDL